MGRLEKLTICSDDFLQPREDKSILKFEGTDAYYCCYKLPLRFKIIFIPAHVGARHH